MARFTPIVERTFKFEGDFQNYPTDKANYSCGVLAGTKMGISAIALQEYYGRCVTENDVRNINKSLAIDVYRKKFWNRIQGDKIANQSVAELIFSQVIANPTQCRIMVADSLEDFGKKVTVQLPFSDEVVKAINQLAPKLLFEDLWKRNFTFYESLRYTYPQFIEGWQNRLSQYKFSRGFPLWAFALVFAGLAGSLYLLNYYGKINLLKLIK